MSRFIAIIPALILLATPAVAQNHDGHDMNHMEDLSRFGAPGADKAATRTVTIKASEIAFDMTSIAVKPGETVRFVLENDGTQDHQLGVGDDAFVAAHEAMLASMPGHDMKLPNIVTAAPGASASFAWTFTKAGTFRFVCFMPGHGALGMQGTITVG